jgi:transcriptional regulator with XRE-family HTH domain
MSEKQIYNEGYRKLILALKSARKRLGYTQEAAAVRIGVKRTWVNKIESCELRLDLLHLISVSKAYGLNAKKLIELMEKDL